MLLCPWTCCRKSEIPALPHQQGLSSWKPSAWDGGGRPLSTPLWLGFLPLLSPESPACEDLETGIQKGRRGDDLAQAGLLLLVGGTTPLC